MTAPHAPGTDRLWGESWYFDFASPDAAAGGFVRVGDYPNLGRRWWWAYVVVGPHAVGCALDRPQPVRREPPWRLADPSLRMSLEPSADGWRISVDGRADGARDSCEDSFSLDLTWRARADAYHYTGGHRLEQPGWANGTVRVDGRSVPLDGPGQRDHSWGVRDWWRFGWTWCAGWLADETRFQATALNARGRIAPDGYLMPSAQPPRPVRSLTLDEDSVTLDGTALRFADVAQVTIDLRAPDGRTGRLRRSLSRVQADGTRVGVGWREHNRPDGGLGTE